MPTTKAPRTNVRMPRTLSSHTDAISAALARPVLGEWPEGTKFHEAEQPEAIGEALVRAVHDHLSSARIGYLFREKLSNRDHVRLAQASRVSGKLAHYSNLDLLIEVNYEEWVKLHPARRVALIDHELCHFGRDEDGSGNTVYKLLAHDLEEFNAIVRRWGAWQPDIKRFADSLGLGDQQDLFAD